ncbi:hypothetical protein CAPTEDRAFT_214456 [Capitella teleta]|uniref:Uncharacterized protein n=1 Tax=Capitella teleta TaxID=283909 RepID=R7US31_CAPTE|nr:hypothetical protein CAPTEDRAFT_214456 [Capitella teleta]|eukprot:ELU09005.1 hypothetical protein CAPTEDRAFT_214456 [Capitella teleta]
MAAVIPYSLRRHNVKKKKKKHPRGVKVKRTKQSQKAVPPKKSKVKPVPVETALAPPKYDRRTVQEADYLNPNQAQPMDPIGLAIAAVNQSKTNLKYAPQLDARQNRLNLLTRAQVPVTHQSSSPMNIPVLSKAEAYSIHHKGERGAGPEGNLAPVHNYRPATGPIAGEPVFEHQAPPARDSTATVAFLERNNVDHMILTNPATKKSVVFTISQFKAAMNFISDPTKPPVTKVPRDSKTVKLLLLMNSRKVGITAEYWFPEAEDPNLAKNMKEEYRHMVLLQTKLDYLRESLKPITDAKRVKSWTETLTGGLLGKGPDAKEGAPASIATVSSVVPRQYRNECPRMVSDLKEICLLDWNGEGNLVDPINQMTLRNTNVFNVLRHIYTIGSSETKDYISKYEPTGINFVMNKVLKCMELQKTGPSDMTGILAKYSGRTVTRTFKGVVYNLVKIFAFLQPLFQLLHANMAVVVPGLLYISDVSFQYFAWAYEWMIIFGEGSIFVNWILKPAAPILDKMSPYMPTGTSAAVQMGIYRWGAQITSATWATCIGGLVSIGLGILRTSQLWAPQQQATMVRERKRLNILQANGPKSPSGGPITPHPREVLGELNLLTVPTIDLTCQSPISPSSILPPPPPNTPFPPTLSPATTELLNVSERYCSGDETEPGDDDVFEEVVIGATQESRKRPRKEPHTVFTYENLPDRLVCEEDESEQAASNLENAQVHLQQGLYQMESLLFTDGDLEDYEDVGSQHRAKCRKFTHKYMAKLDPALYGPSSTLGEVFAHAYSPPELDEIRFEEMQRHQPQPCDRAEIHNRMDTGIVGFDDYWRPNSNERMVLVYEMLTICSAASLPPAVLFRAVRILDSMMQKSEAFEKEGPITWKIRAKAYAAVHTSQKRLLSPKLTLKFLVKVLKFYTCDKSSMETPMPRLPGVEPRTLTTTFTIFEGAVSDEVYGNPPDKDTVYRRAMHTLPMKGNDSLPADSDIAWHIQREAVTTYDALMDTYRTPGVYEIAHVLMERTKSQSINGLIDLILYNFVMKGYDWEVVYGANQEDIQFEEQTRSICLNCKIRAWDDTCVAETGVNYQDILSEALSMYNKDSLIADLDILYRKANDPKYCSVTPHI